MHTANTYGICARAYDDDATHARYCRRTSCCCVRRVVVPPQSIDKSTFKAFASYGAKFQTPISFSVHLDRPQIQKHTKHTTCKYLSLS